MQSSVCMHAHTRSHASVNECESLLTAAVPPLPSPPAGNKLDLVFYDDLVDLDIREFIDSSEWKVLSTSARYNRRMYPCCGDEPYPDLTFYLTVKRRTAFYVYVLILPSVLLSFLTLVLFWIPPQRPDRTSLGNVHGQSR